MKRSNKEGFVALINLIEEYDNIIILRHVNPDGDALGSQWGLATWIKDNYPKKKVLCKGKMDFRNDFFPKHDEEMFKKKYIAIVVDTAGLDRCDEAELVEKADKIVKIDHHGKYQPYGDIIIQDNKIIATSQIIAEYLLTRKDKIISPLCAKYLIAGMMTDSGKFCYNDVNSTTYSVVSKLLKIGKFNISEIALPLYTRTIEEYRYQKEYLQRVQFDGKLAYAIIDQKDLDEIGCTPNRIKEYVFLMENISEIEVWVGVTWFAETQRYRCSLRSKRVNVKNIAHKYEGGGHDNSAGAQVKDLKGLQKLFKDIKKAIEKLGN